MNKLRKFQNIKVTEKNRDQTVPNSENSPSSLRSATPRHQNSTRRTRELDQAPSVQPIGKVANAKDCPNSKGPPHAIKNPIGPHLCQKLQRNLRRQVNLARNHMHGLELRLPAPLNEGWQQLRGDEAVEEIELDARILEDDVDLGVRV
ncbi:hypothetical protein M5K25_015211 [Dendrobium thyrsiflorum]|uniref:Uncharacterized protein n=1 Tax=Dendrobium thyrsiflorum TaxID=117978 RepID=A0ABD0UWS8_DENTH